MWHEALVTRRLPWVRMAEARDCGPAVFASVARYYQHHLSLEQARDLVGTDRNGTTLAGLRDGGRAIGLEARPAQATYEALRQLQLPAIVHLNGQEGHYAILYRWAPGTVVILDPGRGVQRLRRAEFEARWSGYLVEYRPTASLTPRAPEFRPVLLLLRATVAHKGPLSVALLLALLATSLGWAASFFLRALVDQILPNRDARLLVALGMGLIVVSGGQAVLQLLRLWVCAAIGRDLQAAFCRRYIERLMGLPLQIFDVRCVGGLVARINQAEPIQRALSEDLLVLATDGVMFAAALAVILHYDPLAALIAGGAIPLVLAVLFVLNARVYNSQLASIVQAEAFGAQLLDTFDGLQTVKTFGAEERYQRLLAGKLERMIKARFQNRRDTALPAAWSLFAAAVVTAAILWYGGAQVMAGRMTTGELLVLFGMVSFYLMPVQRFPTTLLNIRNALIGLERLEEICTLPSERARTQRPIPLPAVRGQIRFERVSFAYNRHRPVLRDISFVIEPGETIAIVGETGSGKTSLANLIAGFYLPTRGEVAIDGVSTRNLMPEELRRSISAVFQNSRLLQQSVRDNISVTGDAPDEAIRRAAQLAQADAFIRDLRDGYDAQVARGGDNFSSGQAQRIALARALLKKAPILILDEATSNLDSATEQGILEALEEHRHGRTTVVIAHRLSTVLSADRIFVLENGEIVEMGSHEELLHHRGRYYALFRWQLGADAAPEKDVALMA